MEKKQPDWLSKVTYVDEWGHSSVGKPPTVVENEKSEKMNNDHKADQSLKLGKKYLNKAVFEEGSKPDKILKVIQRIQLIIVLAPLIGIVADIAFAIMASVSGETTYFPVFTLITIPSAFFLGIVSIAVELIIITYFAAYNKLNRKSRDKNDIS